MNRSSDQTEMFHGMFRGEPVEFSRAFRGHRFTDEECEALCRGESLRVHVNHGTAGYDVLGALDVQTIQGVRQTFRFVKFVPRGSLPSLQVTQAEPERAAASAIADASRPAEDIAFEQARMEAELAAMIAAPDPQIVQISGPDEPPYFVPVLVMLSDEQLNEIAARSRKSA